MKRMSFFLLLLCFIFLPGLKYIIAQTQVQVKLTQPPPNQLRSTDIWKLILINTSRTTIQISLAGTLEESGAGIIINGTSPQLSLPPGTKLITYDDVKKGNVNFKSGKWREAFTRTGNAPSGDYTICITVLDKSGQEIGRDCIEQKVEISGAPQLISPADGEEIPAGTLPNFTWMAPVPVPSGITYTLKIVEILGNQSPDIAMNQNKAWFSKDKLTTTMFQYLSTAPNLIAGKKYAWTIVPIQKVGEQPVAREVFSFKVTNDREKSMMGGANADFSLDTIYCTSTIGNINYYHIKATYKNSNTSTNNILINDNLPFTGNSAAPAGNGFNLQNNIRTKTGTYNAGLLMLNILESNNGTISNINTPPFNFTTQLIPGQSLHFEFDFSTNASTVQFTFYGLVDDGLKGGTNKNPRNETLVINKFPPCPCNPCKGKSTIFGNSGSSPNISYQNNGSVSVNSTVSFTPDKVIKVTAEIVDVERFGQSGCLSCTKESKEFGNYTGGSLNNNGGHLVNGTNGYGKQIQWQYNIPTLINNFSYDLQMMFPPLTAVSCCKDSIRICTRWSFTDADCITCDTLVCSVITREYNTTTGRLVTTGPNGRIMPTGGNDASQIKELGEPFLSWYNQDNNELPKDFSKQIESLRQKNKNADNELKQEDFEEGMKSTFFTIRNLRSSMSNTSLWDAIKNNNINSMCGNGDFENHILDINEWSGGYGLISYTSNNPTLGTYVSGFAPAANSGLNIPLTTGTGCSSSSYSLSNEATQTHHTIVSYGSDPVLAALLKTTSSSTNLYSFRLGNSCNGYGSEYLSKTFVVGSSGNIKFMYALVMNGVHDTTDNPSFWVKVFDNNGNPISNVAYLDPMSIFPREKVVSSSTDPFFQHSGAVNYRDWSCARIDLSQYVGQVVSVALVTTDCDQSVHWGYAYIDNWCGNCDGSTTGSVNIKAIADSCIKQGTQICVDYSLPKIGTTTGSGTIKLQFYQNGSPVSYTITSPNLTASGTYCFAIDPSQLPCTNGQTGYDVVATGNFHILVGSTTTSITVTSPDPVANYQGIKTGFNNDLVCCGTPADNCCSNFTKDVSTVVSMVGNSTAGYNSIKFVPTFNVGPKLIKQVRISVINFEISSSNKECLTCESNAGRYGTMSVPQNIMGGGKDAIEGMVYPTKPLTMACFPIPCPTWNVLPSSEVTWGGENGPGYNLMDNIGDQTTSFNVSLPKQSTLSCCDETIYICIKYSFTDIDCVTCETVICYKIVNRKIITTIVTAGQGKG